MKTEKQLKFSKLFSKRPGKLLQVNGAVNFSKRKMLKAGPVIAFRGNEKVNFASV